MKKRGGTGERVVTRHCSRIVAEACADILRSSVSIVARAPGELVGGRETKSKGFCEAEGCARPTEAPSMTRLIRPVRQPTSISIATTTTL